MKNQDSEPYACQPLWHSDILNPMSLDGFLTFHFNFLSAGDVPESSMFWLNKSRSESSARLLKWVAAFEKVGFSNDRALLFGAVLGELTNNSFDHNIGKFKEVSGCLVGLYFEKSKFVIGVSDRGQGIAASLRQNPIFTRNFSESEILQKAFQDRVSGRSPEQRGNGLKFVSKVIQENKGSLYCRTQGLSYNEGPILPEYSVFEALDISFGTAIFLSGEK